MSALMLVATAALAQPSPEATKLFDEGRELAKAGKWAEACDRFQQSLALDPAPGTKLNLGDCLEKQGKTRAGWLMFDEAARDFARASDGRAKFARDRAAATAARLATLRIQLAEPQRPGLAIRVGERTVATGATILERVDPGTVTVTATAPDRAPFTTVVDARPGTTAVVDVPAFADPQVAPPPLADTPTNPRRNRVRIAYGLGAGGLLCLAGSGVLGLLAKSQYDGTFDNGECAKVDGKNVCSAKGKAAVDSAGTKADLGTGLLVGGVALAIAGVVVYVTAPTERRISVAPMAASSTAGLVFSATF